MLRDPISFFGWLLVAALAAAPSTARKMRNLDVIPTPTRTLADLPDGARLVTVMAPVSRADVEEATRDLTDAWNGPELSEKISDDKFDKSRFDRVMVTEVPRDARLDLESVRSVQTLDQAIAPDGEGGFVRISTVAATASTRLTVNDPAEGFVNAPGLNELRFRVTEKLGVLP